MNIILTSVNPSKRRSLEIALKKLKINNYNIICLKVSSDAPSRPIGYEIIRGADNRNQNAKEEALRQNINYDYLCSVEGGYSLDENGIPFVVTYAIIEDNKGKKSTGKSLGVRLRKDMFDYIKKGKSLNELIEDIIGQDKNKEELGISGFLTNGLYKRDNVDKDAIMSAMIPFIFKENRDILSEKIKENN
jgi:non-canonical (house-cleaning) NTP pyrophosphatase